MNPYTMPPSNEEFGQEKARILLVDDDPAIRRLLVRLLEEENYEVFPAANGVEAIKLADAGGIDVVLLDLNMPVKDGWKTVEQLSLHNPMLPVILITARPNQTVPAAASGVSALLEKPLDFTKLFQTIQDLLDDSHFEKPAQFKNPARAFTLHNTPMLPREHHFLKPS